MVAQGIAEAVQAYTGLSAAAAVTILALMLATYLLVSSLFVAPDAASPAPAAASKPPQKRQEEEKEEPGAFVPYPESVQLGEITLQQLAAYDGKDPSKPILIAIRGQVYDISRGRLFYGPQGSYSLFAGRDATRALALMSFDPIDLTGDLEGLDPDELEVLQDWEDKFKERLITRKECLTPSLQHWNLDKGRGRPRAFFHSNSALPGLTPLRRKPLNRHVRRGPNLIIATGEPGGGHTFILTWRVPERPICPCLA
ncbi:hypothetical protein GUJ93_ZPchr0013g34158 [Zizania palustris]|uniref:Cytochrome b5 heme-binding domain-containing protein n=1 Tax=Zizania palustris TaxID=103762 RepID=A0A8J5WZ46_ZIZPA|nr:hypothetical protein GUJ93_ZPchr0013g34158 [Zizania palustris]